LEATLSLKVKQDASKKRQLKAAMEKAEKQSERCLTKMRELFEEGRGTMALETS
jgi:hypothetical protein